MDKETMAGLYDITKIFKRHTLQLFSNQAAATARFPKSKTA